MTDQDSYVRTQFGIRFSLLARRWRRAIDAHLAKTGLTDATWAPLVHLEQTGGGMTQKELALLVGVDGSSLVRILDILCREGLIERRKDEKDGRAKLIYLTAEGEARVQEIHRQLFQGEAELLTALSDEDLTVMLSHFEALERRIAELDETRRREAVR